MNVVFPIGSRVRLRHDVDRFPHFVAPAGALGTVVDPPEPDGTAVRLDEIVEGADDWDNEIHWVNGDDPEPDLELVSLPKGSRFVPVGPGPMGYAVRDEWAGEIVYDGIPTPEAAIETAGRLAAKVELDDEQDAAYERVSFPKVELEPAEARFVAESLSFLADVDEGENTDDDRLRALALELDLRQCGARAAALGVELAYSVSGAPLFDSGFANLMLDELEALPVDERPAAVSAVNDGSSVADRRSYEKGQS